MEASSWDIRTVTPLELGTMWRSAVDDLWSQGFWPVLFERGELNELLSPAVDHVCMCIWIPPEDRGEPERAARRMVREGAITQHSRVDVLESAMSEANEERRAGGHEPLAREEFKMASVLASGTALLGGVRLRRRAWASWCPKHEYLRHVPISERVELHGGLGCPECVAELWCQQPEGRRDHALLARLLPVDDLGLCPAELRWALDWALLTPYRKTWQTPDGAEGAVNVWTIRMLGNEHADLWRDWLGGAQEVYLAEPLAVFRG